MYQYPIIIDMRSFSAIPNYWKFINIKLKMRNAAYLSNATKLKSVIS